MRTQLQKLCVRHAFVLATDGVIVMVISVHASTENGGREKSTVRQSSVALASTAQHNTCV